MGLGEARLACPTRAIRPIRPIRRPAAAAPPSGPSYGRLVRAALDGLSPGEREVSELDLRHDLQGV